MAQVSPNGNACVALNGKHHISVIKVLSPLRNMPLKKEVITFHKQEVLCSIFICPFMTFSSRLLNSQIKTHSRRQAQIGICRSSCVLSAVSHPPRNSETCTCHSCECEQLSGLCQAEPATFLGIVPFDHTPLA